jgi:hypothetical protein
VGGSSVVWAETPDDDRDESERERETEAHGEVDESFAERRLRRWLKGMFGGGEPRAAEPEPGRERDD